MKKLLISILLLVFAIPAFAGNWVPTSVIPTEYKWGDGTHVYTFAITLESDGADPAEWNLSDYITDVQLKAIRGGQLLEVITAQGTTAPDTYTVTFDDSYGADLLSITTTSTSQAETWGGDRDLGRFPFIDDLQVDFGDVGDSGDDIVLYIKIGK